ncbi:hypothetical protein T492DRAFT_959810 [Pavlovales sp. CCMP2436]|nr:hypothetical protein T492DRAFT_959810 [Pavlovales sp. CCMP2436]
MTLIVLFSPRDSQRIGEGVTSPKPCLTNPNPTAGARSRLLLNLKTVLVKNQFTVYSTYRSGESLAGEGLNKNRVMAPAAQTLIWPSLDLPYFCNGLGALLSALLPAGLPAGRRKGDAYKYKYVFYACMYIYMGVCVCIYICMYIYRCVLIYTAGASR